MAQVGAEIMLNVGLELFTLIVQTCLTFSLDYHVQQHSCECTFQLGARIDSKALFVFAIAQVLDGVYRKQKRNVCFLIFNIYNIS